MVFGIAAADSVFVSEICLAEGGIFADMGDSVGGKSAGADAAVAVAVAVGVAVAVAVVVAVFGSGAGDYGNYVAVVFSVEVVVVVAAGGGGGCGQTVRNTLLRLRELANSRRS